MRWEFTVSDLRDTFASGNPKNANKASWGGRFNDGDWGQPETCKRLGLREPPVLLMCRFHTVILILQHLHFS